MDAKELKGKSEARRIQEELREKWGGEDRLGQIRTVAGRETAIRMTLAASDGVRIPQPTREADRFVSGSKAAGNGVVRGLSK